MPWTADGTVPDIVVNPHALPTRMTVGQLLEALFAKAACFDGAPADATPFMEHGVQAAAQRLAKHADQTGDELMSAGATGAQAAVPTFLAPTYYMRLKQQVADKVAAANGGRRMAVTGQPARGRAHGGGVRLGEMEQDALVAHGMAAFIKESYVERSDKPVRPYGVLDGRVSVPHSETGVHDSAATDYFAADMPISFKTAMDELGAMGVDVRLGARRA